MIIATSGKYWQLQNMLVHIYSLYMPLTSHLCTENILYTHSSKHSKPPCCKGHLPQQVAFLTRSALTLKQRWPKAVLDRSSRHYTVKGAHPVSLHASTMCVFDIFSAQGMYWQPVSFFSLPSANPLALTSSLSLSLKHILQARFIKSRGRCPQLIGKCVCVGERWHSCKVPLEFQPGTAHGRQWGLDQENRGGMWKKR